MNFSRNQFPLTPRASNWHALLAVVLYSFISQPTLAQETVDKWDYLAVKGRGYVVCDAILKRLNSYRWTRSEVLSHSWHVVATYPGWKDLPWRDLDPAAHEALIRELVRYQQLGADEYFGRKKRLTDDQRRRREEGLHNWKRPANLRLRLSHVHLINWLYDKPADPGEQTIVQLLYPISGKETEALKRESPDKPVASFRDSAYVVTDDLKEPHPGVSEWHAINLTTPRLFENQLYFLGGGALTVGILKDFGSGPYQFCELQFAFKKD